ncbi:unnamed protein product [Dovyalis caffra]|uniref:Uncharacterized protein n=1 Tax=Dovyalis caffra TaxID=77055 RepID=A0AAV1QVG2_9ROSI|nr:unnamed protein product [Dovyalis caffra]
MSGRARLPTRLDKGGDCMTKEGETGAERSRRRCAWQRANGEQEIHEQANSTQRPKQAEQLLGTNREREEAPDGPGEETRPNLSLMNKGAEHNE